MFKPRQNVLEQNMSILHSEHFFHKQFNFGDVRAGSLVQGVFQTGLCKPISTVSVRICQSFGKCKRHFIRAIYHKGVENEKQGLWVILSP